MAYFEFCNSVKIMCGALALDHLPHELENLGVRRPMVLTNDFLVKIGLVDIALGRLRAAGVEIGCIYEDIPADSSVDVVNAAARVFREKDCDGMLAVGGGSVLDTAKGMRIVLSQDSEDLLQFMGSEILPRGNRVPFIAVPTTAGTGSEATYVAVIANPAKQVKMEFLSYSLLPDAAVIDPRMTRSLPARMTASTGMDALSHAVEGYTCLQRNPLSAAYATAAIRLIAEHLPTAVQNGKDEEARLQMALASTMAGASFSNSMVGIVHAIGHACGGVAHVPHGDAMTILLPHCMEYNLDRISGLYGELLLPLVGEYACLNTPPSQRAQTVIQYIRDMSARFHDQCGLPTRLSEAGVAEEQLEQIAATAINDGAILMNPKEADQADVLEILRKAF